MVTYRYEFCLVDLRPTQKVQRYYPKRWKQDGSVGSISREERSQPEPPDDWTSAMTPDELKALSKGHFIWLKPVPSYDDGAASVF